MAKLSRILLLLLALAGPAAAAAPPGPPAIGAKDRQAIVDGIIGALDATYVFPDMAHKMAEGLRRQLGSGAYDRLTTLPTFAEQLTGELQEMSHDRHLGVMWEPPEPPASGPGPSPEERLAQAARRENYCFREVKRLPGNVGYLKLDCFVPADLAGATAVAALGFLAGSDALIFDLRDNGGGYPSMIQLLISHLFPGEPPPSSAAPTCARETAPSSSGLNPGCRGRDSSGRRSTCSPAPAPSRPPRGSPTT